MEAIQRYIAPRSLDEAAEILRAGNVTVLAGGTDLMPQANAGRLPFQPVLMNVRRVPELCGIAKAGGVVRIGALVTISELLESALVRERLGLLWQACDHFASDQIRNAATLGGNVCNASPAGDTLVPLLALEASAVLASKPNGRLEMRRVPLGQFFTGPGRTVRQPTELLAAVELPLPPKGFAGEFYKHGTRPGLDISAISIAFGAVVERKLLTRVRIAFGAVAPTPIRAPRTEAVLEGRAPDAAILEAAAQAALAEIHPISDVRASDWYRRELVRNMLKRVISHVGLL
ncbi:MAG: medium FAD-binding subunit of molybdenum enzyme [Betaproteobacteria bacterium RIFCSPLOWO2_12_FULL_65_14]|nr:MAG: medium FAD-binding subunit of molybdenum enzyme [Betaproteobacteria bacterium RIFCSPLOWO2_12_FULL_65_14]